MRLHRKTQSAFIHYLQMVTSANNVCKLVLSSIHWYILLDATYLPEMLYYEINTERTSLAATV